MKKHLLLLGALAALATTSCGSSDKADDPNLLVSNDFDSLAGWLPASDNAAFGRDKAHSGHYSIKVEPGRDYSLAFKMPLVQLHETRIKKVKLSGWVFVPTADAKASLVLAVDNPAPANKQLLWDAVEVGKTGVGKWTEVSKVFTIPEGATPTSILSIYMWRTGGNQPIYLDDVRLTLEE